MNARSNHCLAIAIASAAFAVAVAFALVALTPAFAAQNDANTLATGAAQAQTQSRSLVVSSKSPVPWTGKVVKPKVTVRCGSKKLKAGRDYRIVYPNSKALGYYTFEVIGKGAYKGLSSSGYYIVSPHARKILSAKRQGSTLKLKWQTYPDKTEYYFVICGKSKADVSARLTRLLEEYDFWDTMGTLQHSNWDQWVYMKNSSIKKKWGAGRMNINVKKYLGGSYKKRSIYVGVCPAYPIYESLGTGKMVIKKVKL